MSLRAKMRVGAVSKSYRAINWNKPEEGILESMTFSLIPVCGQGNEEWNKLTPSGELKLVVNNPATFSFIEAMPGKEFYVDISEV
jgi:hypothetical protein